MKTQPKVAIITRTVKGREVLLERAIHSVLRQNFQDYIHVIIADKSDSTTGIEPSKYVQQYLSLYNDKIAFIQSSEPSGQIMDLLNYAINQSESKYIVVHDDDDSWYPEFLQETITFLENHPEYEGVVTQVMKITEELKDGRIKRISSEPFKSDLITIAFDKVTGESHFPPISFVFKRAQAKEIGLFDQRWSIVGDWDFALRYCKKFELGVIPEILANYHFRYTTDPDIGNTVTVGVHNHFRYETLMRNNYFREELKAGTASFSEMMAISRGFARCESMLGQIYLQNAALQKELAEVKQELSARKIKGSDKK